MELPDPVCPHIRKIQLDFPVGCIQFRHFPLICKTCIPRHFILAFRSFYRKIQMVKPFAVTGSLSLFHNIRKCKTHFLYVIKILRDAFYRSPKPAPADTSVPKGYFFFLCLQAALSACKTVRKNIIDDGSLKPLRHIRYFLL